ncbi:MAG TPA: polyprenol monophosphomannose synthase [Fibrobacteria bacterium]|nr:polyprenol monophosphomannose synthase [Fibrobacteria bacterium]HOX52338.1 polyprenol monophosphomannose synthase [Fibrobacteria bacterium]
MSARKTLIVVPTYNEKDNITELLDTLMGFPETVHVLVVDDGSPDGTGDIVEARGRESSRVHLMRRAGKMGLGSAYVAGFRWALERDYERVFEMDADFSHDPKYVPQMLEASESADLVIGSRYLTGVNVVNWPMSRLLLSWFANKYAKFVSGLPIADCTAGFKCFRREALESVDFDGISASGYGFQIEMNFKVWKKGFRLAEVPIVFVDRRAGVSKMSGKIIREALLLVVRLRMGRHR